MTGDCGALHPSVPGRWCTETAGHDWPHRSQNDSGGFLTLVWDTNVTVGRDLTGDWEMSQEQHEQDAR